jgi:RNA polymerase sigma-70 factor (ECF subfamily)
LSAKPQSIAGNCTASANARRRATSAFPSLAQRQEHLTAQFVQACADGDLNALLATLAGDVILWSDGGGKARAATRPIHGADGVARFVLDGLRKAPAGLVNQTSRVNGQPAVIAYLAGQPFAVITLDVSADGIRAITIVVNPDKLRAVPPVDAGSGKVGQ